MRCSQGRSTQYSHYCYFFTELCAALRAGVLNIHITVIFPELYAALRAEVLNIHITVIFFTELYAALRAGVLNFHINVIFYCTTRCSQGRSTQYSYYCYFS